MSELEKELKIEITEEERDLIFKGIRPENMDFSLFKMLRSSVKQSLKDYKKSRYIHISTEPYVKKSDKG